MKKLFILAVLVLLQMLFVPTAEAYEPGTWRLSGGTAGGFSTTTLEDTGGDVDIDQTAIFLSGGYFINSNIELGLTYSSSSQEIDGEELTGEDLIIPFFNYYIPAAADYIRFGAGYATGTVSIAGEDIDVDGFQVRAGYIKMISEMFSIDIEAIYEDTEWSAFGETLDATGTTIGASFSVYL